jgi:hypothetical protein
MKPESIPLIDRTPPPDAPSAFDGYTVAEAAKLSPEERTRLLTELVERRRREAKDGR